MLRSLNDSDLLTQTRQAAVQEQSATLRLLEFLQEIDRRRLYAARGYSGLWEYVHKALGYSETQASDRVNAMRAMVEVPEVREKLETRELTLTSAAKLGSHMRREKLNQQEGLSLLREIQGKSSRDVERVLVANSTELPKPERARAITPELTRITLDVDQDFLALVARVKELKGNPALSLQEAFSSALQEYIKRREPKAPKPQSGCSPTLAPACKVAPLSVSQQMPASTQAASRSRYIKIVDKNMIRLRSQDQCEYIDRQTGRRCESKTGLQLDHIRPFAKQGSNRVQNLRHLCPAHNRFMALKEFGAQKMQPYLSG